MYKQVKRLRVALSLAVAVALALSVADAELGATPFGRWIMDTQLVPAMLAGSVIWMVAWVVITLIFGRVYCSCVCPMGTVMDVAAHCGRRLGRGPASRYSYMRPLNGLRFPIPALVGLCLFAGALAVVQRTDPSYLYYRIVMAVARPLAIGLGSLIGAAIVLAAVSVVAWRRGRILCNTVCPIGGLLGLLSRGPVYRIDINTDLCVHCGKCEDVCKAHCIDLSLCTVDNSRCVRCFNCTAVCPNSAIALRRGRTPLSTPMMQPIKN